VNPDDLREEGWCPSAFFSRLLVCLMGFEVAEEERQEEVTVTRSTTEPLVRESQLLGFVYFPFPWQGKHFRVFLCLCGGSDLGVCGLRQACGGVVITTGLWQVFWSSFEWSVTGFLNGFVYCFFSFMIM